VKRPAARTTIVLGAMALVVAIALGLYSLKKTLGIDVFANFSLSGYPPFRQLGAPPVIDPAPGESILDEDFADRIELPRRWGRSVMSGSGPFDVEYAPAGADGSRCLVVRSHAATWWNIADRYSVSVAGGEQFHATVLARNGSAIGRAELQAAAYDASHQVIAWDRWRSVSQRRNDFERLELEFTIPEGVAFVRLRLAGWGEGEFRFDDVRFVRVH